jgi:tetratricopeptide (TPR) repeat protein
MLFKWLDGTEASEAGTALADDFYLQSGSPSDAQRRPQRQDLQRFLQRFLQQVDRAARPLKLNFFKRAKLANSFKWRLLEKGVERGLVDELTQALVLRLNGAAAPAARAAGAGSATGRRGSAQEAQALRARGHEALARRGFAEALECYQALANLDSRDFAAHNGLGIALAQLARYDEAEQELRRAIGLRPSNPEAHFNLAGVLQSTGRHEESESPLRRALKLKPSYIEARVGLGTTLVLLGRLGEARDTYQMALRVAPRNAQALVGLGQIEGLEGHFAEAEAAYRRALEADPNASFAWAALAWLRKMAPGDEAWVKRAEQIAESGLTAHDEATLRFAVGKYYDDIGDYPRAFRAYQRANELHKLRARPYDREGHVRFVDDLIRVYTPEALERARDAASDSARPVFVVGMPRSGTSLVEQIIASHARAFGAGELSFWPMAAHRHESTLRRELLAEPQRRKLAHDYLRLLGAHSGAAERVVDKQPANADYLGPIHSVFPKARILYLRRDPIDTCLSCYFQQFPPALDYTMDLEDLAHYYRVHRRLVSHWRSVLPADTFLEVPYAELTADPQAWTRRILEFLGLPWDERCLEFHRTPRAVTTASVWQVRQKIYRTSVERWRNYEKFLGPLRALADLTP